MNLAKRLAMSEFNEKEVNSTEEDRPESVSRRKLLRSGVTAMPAILTLQSGAALARSSNMISAAPTETKDRLGRTLCLDTNSVYPVGDSGHHYDLGNPPQAEITILTDRDYKLRRNRRGSRVSEGTMCERGGTYWFNDRNGEGWQSVTLPQNGVVVSSGAMTSIADHVYETLI